MGYIYDKNVIYVNINKIKIEKCKNQDNHFFNVILTGFFVYIITSLSNKVLNF